MGFFGWLKEAALNVAAVALAPVAIPAMIIEEAFSTKEESKNVAKAGNLTETSSARQVEKVHEALTISNEKYVREAEKKEKAYQKYINDCFAKIICSLQQDEAISKNFDLENLLFEQKNLCRQMQGIITRRVHTELTLDNQKIRQIMAISSEAEREKSLEQYADKTLKSAADDAADKCKLTLNIQMEQIDEFLQDYVDKKNREAERMKNRFAEMEKAMQSKTFDADKASLDPKVKLYAVNTIDRIFAA